MARSRTLVGALALALLSFGAVATAASSASAAPDRKIWGVVEDGRGQPVLDVVVRALDRDGLTAASDRSYDDPDGNGAPKPGYFELFPPTNGTYTVTLKKAGFVPAKVSGVKIGKGQRVQGLGELELIRTSTTSAKLVRATVLVGDRGKVKITVAPTGTKPTGAVVVKEGRSKVGSATLRATHRGEIAVTLDKLPRGSHDLKVSYLGSRVHQGSTSAKLTLTVKAPKRKRQLPNALAYIG